MVDYKNTLTNHDAMVCLAAFIDLLEKYETALLEISKSDLPPNLKKLAIDAINYGNELVDGPPN